VLHNPSPFLSDGCLPGALVERTAKGSPHLVRPSRWRSAARSGAFDLSLNHQSLNRDISPARHVSEESKNAGLNDGGQTLPDAESLKDGLISPEFGPRNSKHFSPAPHLKSVYSPPLTRSVHVSQA